MNLLIKKPVISEQSMQEAKTGVFTFLVDKKARKIEIAQAIEEKFKVKVVSVKTINMKGEQKMQKRIRKYYQTATCKKALVALKDGQKISLFEEESKVEEPQEGAVKEKKSLLKGTKVKVEKVGSEDKKVEKKGDSK